MVGKNSSYRPPPSLTVNTLQLTMTMEFVNDDDDNKDLAGDRQSSSTFYNDNAVRYDPRLLDDNGHYSKDDDGTLSFLSPGGGGGVAARPNMGNRRRPTNGEGFGATTCPLSSSQSQSQSLSPKRSSSSTTSLRAMTIVEDGKNRLGFCCYDQSRNEIIFEECHVAASSSSSFSSSNAPDGVTTDVLLEEILMSIRPTLLLLNNRIVQNEDLFDILTRPFPLQQPMQEDDDDDEDNDDGDDDDDDKNDKGSAIRNRSSKRQRDCQRHRESQESRQQDDSNQNPQSFAPSTIPYKILKSKYFDMTACRKIILQKLHVLSLNRRTCNTQCHHNSEAPSSFRQQQQQQNNTNFNNNFAQYRTFSTSNYHSLASIIDFDSKVIVQAIGSLLSFLAANFFPRSFQCNNFDDAKNSHSVAHGEWPGGGKITINRMVLAQISKYMYISPSTLSALQIFSTEQHPLLFAEGYGNAKEGFSLFSYLDRTKSRGGRQKLREWMMRPLADLHHIVARHDMVEFFLHSSVEKPVGHLMKLLRTVRSIDKIMARMNRIATTPRDFLDLMSTLNSAICIAKILYEEIIPIARSATSRSCYESLNHLYSRCNLDLMIDLKNRICDMVDEEEMSKSGSKLIIIRSGYDERLDGLRRQADLVEERLYHAQRIIDDRLRATLPPAALTLMALSFNSLTVTFKPQIGYLVGFIDHEREIQEALPEDFEYIGSHDGEDFYCCDETRVLADQFGDFYSEMKDIEKQIIGDMEGTILDTEVELQDCFDALSELDCFLSFAEIAIDCNFIKPRMVDERKHKDSRLRKRQNASQDQDDSRSLPPLDEKPIIDIRDGRHPLQEMTSEHLFVPNDVHITSTARVNVVTGPNFSGKSCYLRQVGLLVYMAHIGSFIPCSSATIPVTNHIGARIPTAESCSRPQSSFQRELTEISSILRRVTRKSLVLLDEFGKGTNPTSGISILGATLKHLAKVQCPTICATHLLELFSMNVIADGQEGIRAIRMTMKLPDCTAGGKALPLFKLEDGVSPSSAATVCAQTAGVDPNVLERTQLIVETRRFHKSIYRLWTMNRGDPLTKKQLQILADFVSTEAWAAEREEEVTTLLRNAVNLI